MKMKKKLNFIIHSLLLIIASILIDGVSCQAEAQPNATAVHATLRTAEWRPSFWTKTANNLKSSTLTRMYKPYGNLTKLHKRIITNQENDPLKGTETTATTISSMRVKSALGTTVEHSTTEAAGYETTPPSPADKDDIETKILNDESLNGLKEFADQLINDTVKFFSKNNGHPRSYQMDEPPPHQMWDDKDQTYHSSSLTAADYEPSSFHHHYLPPPPLHYYPPPKKEDTLLTKVALIALLKLILAKLKAIGFIKLMFLFMMKIPVLFFKFLFVLKSFKILKLVSVPFIIASFILPFLPLIPLLAPLLFAPIFFMPLLLPLLLPLLFFLPIVPVSTQQPQTQRERREVTFNNPVPEENFVDDGTKGRYLRNRARPMAYDGRMNLFEYTGVSRLGHYEEVEDIPNILELTQKIAESHHCMERVACELARQNDSKIYQAAVIWALEKVQNLASVRVRRKIERYSDAYKIGTKVKSSDVCGNKFYCQRPKILLVQGKSKYNVF